MAFRRKRALAAALLIVVAAAFPVAATIKADRAIEFAVSRDNSPIGWHKVTLREDGSKLFVEVDIELKISLAFITLFEYTHRNQEIWQGGRLISLDSWTNDDGAEYRVRARATDDGVLVNGTGGRFVAPADIVPTSYWNADTVDQRQLLDTQRGRLIDVSVTPSGGDWIVPNGERVSAQRYHISGDLELDIWYADSDWVKITFEARGAEIAYALQSFDANGEESKRDPLPTARR